MDPVGLLDCLCCDIFTLLCCIDCLWATEWNARRPSNISFPYTSDHWLVEGQAEAQKLKMATQINVDRHMMAECVGVCDEEALTTFTAPVRRLDHPSAGRMELGRGP